MLNLIDMKLHDAAQPIMKFMNDYKRCHLFEPTDICVRRPVEKLCG